MSLQLLPAIGVGGGEDGSVRAKLMESLPVIKQINEEFQDPVRESALDIVFALIFPTACTCSLWLNHTQHFSLSLSLSLSLPLSLPHSRSLSLSISLPVSHFPYSIE